MSMKKQEVEDLLLTVFEGQMKEALKRGDRDTAMVMGNHIADLVEDKFWDDMGYRPF